VLSWPAGFVAFTDPDQITLCSAEAHHRPSLGRRPTSESRFATKLRLHLLTASKEDAEHSTIDRYNRSKLFVAWDGDPSILRSFRLSCWSEPYPHVINSIMQEQEADPN
jgi:hypothetical protein